jgi:hypothetical protein
MVGGLMEEEGSPITAVPREVSTLAQRDKLRVFISYSRDDLDFADQLDVGLRLCGFDTSLDRHAISGGEEWKRRLGNLIREADTVVFVLSPSSAGSEICAWEVEEAARNGKRTIPALPRSLDGASPPQRLRDLNYIFFYPEPKAPGSGFGSGLAQLVAALNTDFDWLREHTRLLLRADEWNSGGRATNRLLSGNDITAAKAWAARRPKGAPEPTALQREFIRASEEAEDARLSAQRRQLEEMAAAQQEREKALRAAEEANRQRARLRITAFTLLSGAVAILIGIASYAMVQTGRAEREYQRAEESRTDVAKVATLAREELSYSVSWREDGLDDMLSWAPPAWSAYLHNQRALARTEARKFSAALSDAETAKKENPEYIPTLVESSGLDVVLGDAKAAVQDATAYLQIDKAEPAAYENLILGEGMLGHYAEAIKAIDEALENCHPPTDTVNLKVAPDLEDVTHGFRVAVRGSDTLLVLRYVKAFLYAMTGDGRFAAELEAVNHSDADYPYSMDAYLAGLNWAWYIVRGQGPYRVTSSPDAATSAPPKELTDYGAYAGEGALWDLVARTRPAYHALARGAYEKFRGAYLTNPQDRYKALADWVERRLAATAPVAPPDQSAANAARELAQEAEELRGSSASDIVRYAPAHARLSEAIDLLATKQKSGQRNSTLGRREQDLLIVLLLRRADWRLSAGDKGGAAEDARRVIALDDKIADAYRVLAASAFDDDTRKVNDEQALRLRPYNSDALQDLADLVQNDDPERALALLQKRQRVSIFWSNGYLQLSRLHWRLKKYPEALLSIESAIARAPWQSSLYETRRQIESAAGVARGPIALHFVQGLRARADYEVRVGNDGLALETYLQAFVQLSKLENPEGDVGAELRTIIRDLSIFLTAGYKNDSAQEFWRALARDPLLTRSQQQLATAEADRLAQER